MSKCTWALQSKLDEQYHDDEWGVLVFDEAKLFELLILEGMQAGLKWSTILSKRNGMRDAYHFFNPSILSKLTEEDVNNYLKDDRVIKNKLKIKSVITNSKCYFELIKAHGSLKDFLWKHVNYEQIVNKWTKMEQVPSSNEISVIISDKLKKMGFKFVGPKIIYALMQSIGMVNDHLVTCPYYIRDNI